VRVNGHDDKAFGVRVDVHQGSVLSPLPFVIKLEALSGDFREGLPMELQYGDDLVLMETEELLVEKIQKCEKTMEEKGLRVTFGRTKVIKCEARPTEKIAEWLCGVCSKGVGSMSIKSNQCSQWVHRCSGVSGKPQNVAGFRCKRCVDAHLF